MEKERLDLAPLIGSAVEAIQPLAERSGVRLAVQAEHVKLLADPDRLVQVLTNLLSNAVKFSSPAGTVTCSARLGEARCSSR